MLLDEVSLAQDTVLQCIEEAIDTQQLTLRDTSSASHPVQTIQMYPEFRLFATQNPNSGFFKGKREELSQSFLSRFVPLMFNELPNEEWKQIVASKLAAGSEPNASDKDVAGE